MADIGERKLATIRRIAKIEPIEGADRIVKATIDGWELVTQKGNYKVNDLALYFEIDSFLPVREEFEFLRKGCFKSTANLGDGFRIKTIKLRGQVSQGLSLPLADFFEKDEGGYWYYRPETEAERAQLERREDVDTKTYLEEGTDLTEYFRVQKYEKPIAGPGGSKFGPMGARGNFPDFIPKTDQERVQNCLGSVKKWIYFGGSEVFEVADPRVIELLEAGKIENTADTHYFKSGDQWFKRFSLRNDEGVVAERRVFEATLKLDGSSMTVYHRDGQIGVCSRNNDLTRNADNAFWRTAIESEILAFLVQDGRNLAVQGELMGPGVQGNREELETHGFYVFDVYLVDDKRYMTPDERDDFFAVVYDFVDPDGSVLSHVPSVRFEFEVDEDMTVADFLAKADSISSVNNPVAEGIVFKSHVAGGPSFKVISNKFLLAEKD